MDEAGEWLEQGAIAVFIAVQAAGAVVGHVLGRRWGVFGQLVALSICGVVPIAITWALLARAAAVPCPPEYELQCGEGFGYIGFGGLVCAGAGVFVGGLVQLWVYAMLHPPRGAENGRKGHDDPAAG